MALQFFQPFPPTQLGNSVSVIFTVPSVPGTTVFIRGRVRLTNTDSNAHGVTLYSVQLSGSPALSNMFANAETISPNSHMDIDVPILAAGGTLRAFADATGWVTITSLDGILFS